MDAENVGARADAIEERAGHWLARQDGDDWDIAAERELADWLATDTRHRVAYLRLRGAWRRADALAGQANLHDRAPTTALRSRTSQRQWTSRLAAALVVACALGTLFKLSRDPAPRRYATRVGESHAIALPDGSRITLNTGTRLRASASMRDGVRHVWLDGGEAYFDVAHDPGHPFVIDAGSSRVTVLGTRFTVRHDGPRTTVLVAQGHVRVSDSGKTVDLVQDEETTARAGGFSSITHSPVETEHRLAWREGRLVFDATTLTDAIAEFNRYNERQLVIADPAVGRLVIGGSFAPANIDGFVRLLEQGFALRAEHRGNTIAISR
jgi:transmembrane sensor